MNNFEEFSLKEFEVGNDFANIFNLKYIKNNNQNKFDIDGKINEKLIELQELKSKKTIENSNIVIDGLSCFSFKGEKRKSIKLSDEDIIISKYGKLFNLKDNTIYLIYIDISLLNQCKETNYSKEFKTNNNLFLPLNVNKLKQVLKNQITFFVNDKEKNKLSDTWESAFCYINNHIINKCLYSKNELNDLFKHNIDVLNEEKINIVDINNLIEIDFNER